MAELPVRSVAVFGAGGVGGHLAARLHLAGAKVTLLARGASLQAIQARGLILLSGQEVLHAPVAVVDTPQKLEPPDLWVIAVKGRALRAALEQVAPTLAPTSRVLFAMNGLPWWFDHVVDEPGRGAVQAALKTGAGLDGIVSLEKVVWGVVVAGGVVLEPGVVRNTTPGRNAIEIGTPDGRMDTQLLSIVAMLQSAGFQASATPTIRERIWSKLLLNAGQAMVATVCERTPLQTVSDPQTRELVVNTMNEIMAVGRALGIAVVADPVAMTEPSRSASHRSSFLQDLQARRPLELENTILAVRDIARAMHLAVPHLSAVAAIVAARSADAAASST